MATPQDISTLATRAKRLHHLLQQLKTVPPRRPDIRVMRPRPQSQPPANLNLIEVDRQVTIMLKGHVNAQLIAGGVIRRPVAFQWQEFGAYCDAIVDNSVAVASSVFSDACLQVLSAVVVQLERCCVPSDAPNMQVVHRMVRKYVR